MAALAPGIAARSHADVRARLARVCTLMLVAGACATPPPVTDSSADAGSSGGTAGQSGTGGATSTSTTTAPTSSTSEVATTAAPAATSEAATTSEAPGFIPVPDGGLAGCDTYEQTCPRGMKCMPWAADDGNAWNATKCVDVVDDPKQVGEACTAFGGATSGEDDCELGAMCWDVDDQGHGACVALCGGNEAAPTCPGDASCHFGREFSLCLVDCDPLIQDCPDDESCIASGDQFLCILDASGDEGQAHDPCEFANACDKGLQCIHPGAASSECDPAATGCCEPFCEFPGGPCPAADQQCVQWYDPQMLPVDDPKLAYGVCSIPD